MQRNYADKGYQSGIGTFDGLAYKDGEIGAIMHRTVDNVAPGSISVTRFWSKESLENERELLETNPSERFRGQEPNEAIVSDTLTEINYALERIETISPDLIERMKTAVGTDLQQQYIDMGVPGRFAAAIHPEKLRFSSAASDYAQLQAVAEEIQPDDRDHLVQSMIYNAIGTSAANSFVMGIRTRPVYEGEAAQHQADKNPLRRLAEAVYPTSYEATPLQAEA